MNKLPTAEEFIEKYLDVDSDFMESIRFQMSKMSGFDFDNIPDLIVEFAKLHRVAILQAASDTKLPPQWYGESDSRPRNYDDKNTILNSYSENLIH